MACGLRQRLRLAYQPAGVETGGARRIQLLDDVGKEQQVARFLDEHPDWTIEPPAEGVVPAAVLDEGMLRVLPQRDGTDGAFAARLRRGTGEA